MSLESAVHNVRDFVKTFRGIIEIENALEDALAAEQKAASAEKRSQQAEADFEKANYTKALALVEAAKIKSEADAVLAAAKVDAAAIRKEAKEKADITVQKAKEKADSIAEANATALEKFALQKQTNDEVLDMTKAQIAHAEAKMDEIRAAIAKITGA